MCQDEQMRRRRAITKIPSPEESQPSLKQTIHNDADDSTYILTRKVVSHHNSANDGWVIYEGSIYDVTMFLESHPGGSDILIEHLGKDVTEIMNGEEGNHEHSPFAFKLLEKYRIGQVIDGENGQVAPDGNIDSENGKALVNWNEPILHQVGMLGEKYNKWIHSFPTTDHTVKMFTNDTIENLTKCPWYMPLVFWIPVISFEFIHFIYLIGGLSQLHIIQTLVMCFIGIVCWLLFEYSLHRWIFHWKSTGYYGNIIHFLIHGHHHITPMDFDRLVFPPVPALIIAAPFWYSAPRFLGAHMGYPWLIGFAVGYLIYDMTHFWIHHGIPSNVLMKQQKRRHVHHHYFQPNVNFGISNPLFDHVFGTIKEPAQ